MHLLQQTSTQGVGGKIANLKRLMDVGIGKIPVSYVSHWANPTEEAHVTKLLTKYKIFKFPIAVRSSGFAEDGDVASYAGQFLTVLNVDREGVWEAMQACLASAGEAPAEYQRMWGDKIAPMSLLLQEMVDASVSGVLFTGNADTGDVNTSVLEWTEGLGDRLVGGEIVPSGSYEYDLHTSVVSRSRGQAWRREFDDVIDLGKQIGRVFGVPMDIEWAIDQAGVLWLLQARPLTGVTWEYGSNLRGHVVGVGVATGTAYWGGRDVGGEIREGQVLLAEMTNPRMVRAMIRSAGIATIQGGRTCHAAIIARELGKPCVVGCEYLGQIENGTRITVDANVGEVRIENDGN